MALHDADRSDLETANRKLLRLFSTEAQLGYVILVQLVGDSPGVISGGDFIGRGRKNGPGWVHGLNEGDTGMAPAFVSLWEFVLHES